jgi:HD-like signal output (HDOD) protein
LCYASSTGNSNRKMASINTMEITKISGLSNLDFLVAEVDKLVSLPDIYYRLESAIESPSSTIEDFSKLLGSDPDLCARLLSLANSAFYSFPSKVESIDRAVGMIGLRQIRELVLVTTVMKAFSKIPIEIVNMNSFWKHSVAVGVLAKSIAQYAGLPHTDRYYVVGLLHDIGRLVMYLKLPGFMDDLLTKCQQQEQSLFFLEQQQLAYTHAEIGGRLLEFWKVPQSIYEPVQFHHRPDQASEYVHMACAVHIADAWVNKNQIGTSGERGMPSIAPEATQLLDVQEYEMDEIWSLTIDEINDVIKQFVRH